MAVAKWTRALAGVSWLTASLLAGCGDNVPALGLDGGPTPGADDAAVPDAGGLDAAVDPCATVTLGERDFQFNLFGQLTGLAYRVLAADGSPAGTLLVELYDSTTEGLGPLAPGTFDLAAAPDDDLATCQHCVWIRLEGADAAPTDRAFLAAEGSMTLDRVRDPLEPVFAGSLSEIVLAEVTIDGVGGSTPVEGGGCVRLAPLAFDTAPTPGLRCLSAESCGNPLLEVCSPATGMCGPPECGDFQGCADPARPLCISQYRDLFEGACYADCDPALPGDCGLGGDCLQLGVDPRFGVCKAIGSGDVGEACEPEDISTSCEDGALCDPDALVCTASCSYFADDPGCPAGARCDVLGVCHPEASGADVGLGDDCPPDATLAQGCAADGGAFRGVCFGFEADDPLVCQEACFGALGCEPEEFCALRFSSGLGVCLPDPVCGDGELGEIDEVCDDGNTASDDGCSGDCQTVEYGPICAGAPALAPDSTTAGDTAAGWDGFFSTCQAGIARADVYRFTPPGRGRLRLTLGSPTLQIMSVRTSCADGGSEVGCADNDESGAAPELIIQVTDAAADLTVLVSALTVLEQGPYTLDAAWTPELCGDGVVAGGEVCDDGNTASDDGCSGDCAVVEYDVYCAQAPTLVAGAPYTGDNTGGPAIYDGSCSNDFLGTGPDRLHRFVATDDGTLLLRLDQGAADLSLVVFDGCGVPGSFPELGCSSVLGEEELEVPVTAGQELTILVEGFGPGSAGPYTLTSQLVQ
jgi:cysteine-rich repeat protein